MKYLKKLGLSHFIFFSIFLNQAVLANTVISNQILKDPDWSPIGDNLHVLVYDFILDELMKNQNYSKKQLEKIKKEEEECSKHPESLKPLTACVIETQFSHILSSICKSRDDCRALYLFQKDGLLIGTGEVEESYINNPFLENPFKTLGIRKLDCEGSNCTYVITWAIYRQEIHPQHFIGVISFTKLPEDKGRLIGFLQLVKKAPNK